MQHKVLAVVTFKGDSHKAERLFNKFQEEVESMGGAVVNVERATIGDLEDFAPAESGGAHLLVAPIDVDDE